MIPVSGDWLAEVNKHVVFLCPLKASELRTITQTLTVSGSLQTVELGEARVGH